MTAIVLAMLLCVGLAALVVLLVAIPARRQGRALLTERGEDVVAGVRERGEVVSARTGAAVDRVRARRAERRAGGESDELDEMDDYDDEIVEGELMDDEHLDDATYDDATPSRRASR